VPSRRRAGRPWPTRNSAHGSVDAGGAGSAPCFGSPQPSCRKSGRDGEAGAQANARWPVIRSPLPWISTLYRAVTCSISSSPRGGGCATVPPGQSSCGWINPGNRSARGQVHSGCRRPGKRGASVATVGLLQQPRGRRACPGASPPGRVGRGPRRTGSGGPGRHAPGAYGASASEGHRRRDPCSLVRASASDATAWTLTSYWPAAMSSIWVTGPPVDALDRVGCQTLEVGSRAQP
jgi:hypothetical protein